MLVFDVVSLYDIAKHYLLVKSIKPVPFVTVKQQFGEATPLEVFGEILLYNVSLLAILPIVIKNYSVRPKVLYKRIRKDLFVKISCSESRGYVATQLLCIGASNKDHVFLIGEPTGKMLPPFYVLYLVEKQDWPIRKHCAVSLQYQVKIIHFHAIQTLVIEVDIHYFLDVMTVCKKLFGTLIQQERLARLPDANKDIPALFLKNERPCIEFNVADFVLSLLYKCLEYFFLHCVSVSYGAKIRLSFIAAK